MQRSGRVGGNVFNQNVDALSCLILPVVIALCQYFVDNVGKNILSDLEIDEAGAGYFDSFDLRHLFQHGILYFLTDLSGVASQYLGKSHGQIRGIIALAAVLWHFDHDKAFLRYQVISFLKYFLQGIN